MTTPTIVRDVGYFAMRVLGGRLGVVSAALLGGLSSSPAVAIVAGEGLQSAFGTAGVWRSADAGHGLDRAGGGARGRPDHGAVTPR